MPFHDAALERSIDQLSVRLRFDTKDHEVILPSNCPTASERRSPRLRVRSGLLGIDEWAGVAGAPARHEMGVFDGEPIPWRVQSRQNRRYFPTGLNRHQLSLWAASAAITNSSAADGESTPSSFSGTARLHRGGPRRRSWMLELLWTDLAVIPFRPLGTHVGARRMKPDGPLTA